VLFCGLLCLVLAALGASAVPAHPGLHHDIEAASKAIAADPDNAELYARRAHYLRLSAQYDQSLADLEKGKEIDPSSNAVRLGLGLTLSALSRDAEAEASLNEFIESGGRVVPAFTGRAEIRARDGRIVDAIADYTSALDIQQKLDTYLARGALQEQAGDLNAAAEGYAEGLESLGGAVTMRLALIRVQNEQGRFDEALELIDRELQRAPVKTDWYLSRAQVLESAGRTAEARATIVQALAEANRVIALRATGIHMFTRAKVYMALGRTDEARQELAEVLAKSPRFSEALELLAQLDATDPARED